MYFFFNTWYKKYCLVTLFVIYYFWNFILMLILLISFPYIFYAPKKWYNTRLGGGNA